MNRFFAKTAILLFGFISSFASYAGGVRNINPVFYTEAQSADYLASNDQHFSHWGDFDRLSRIKRSNVSADSIKLFVSAQARSWNSITTNRVKASVETLNQNIKQNDYNLPLPEKVPFLVTSMQEEGGSGAAAYTCHDGVALSERAARYYEDLDELIAHELFHVLTRNNPKFRAKMYELIGFKLLRKEIEIPESFKNKVIANPDVICHNSYATFTINGKKVDCAMFIFANQEFKGGSFFDYMRVGLVEIDRKKCCCVLKDGQPVIHSVDEAVDFYEKVGHNTDYIIDPEEILADNFSNVLCNRGDSKLATSIRNMISK